MKKILFTTITILLLFTSCSKINQDFNEIPQENVEESIKGDEQNNKQEQKLPLYTLNTPDGDPVPLKECWGYVVSGRENEYNSDFPVTDVCYFSAEINLYGELVNIPKRSKIDQGQKRCHLVISCDSKSLTHFILDPEFNIKRKLIKEIVKASQDYDGVQIDFELVPPRDRKHFIQFLGDLRYCLDGKTFSVCVPARFKLLSEDIYPYEEISRYCDRVFVMAYDEHWSGSKPGPIASVDWCIKVLEYAQKAIPEQKLIMGIPFYGRTWASETTAGAWYFSGANRIMTEHDTPEVIYENSIPTFKYTTQVEVTGYFNDAYSCHRLCQLYENSGVNKMGFWRIGQEDPDFWQWITIE